MGSGNPGHTPHHKKAEKYENGNWSDIPDAPVASKLSHYAVIFNAGNFYYFGGSLGYPDNTIRSLSAATWTWSEVGRLNAARYGHGVILVDNNFMIVGGNGNQPNEACHLNNGQFICEQKTSRLTNFYGSQILFRVSENYELCSN